MSAQVETYQFQVETKRLLDMMIHSLYTTKDIFLRERASKTLKASVRLVLDKRARHILHPQAT